MLADKGYDSDWFRTVIAAAGAEAVMPSNRARSRAIPYDKIVYKDRNLVVSPGVEYSLIVGIENSLAGTFA
ncbi:MAG: hypothetical protein KJ587_13285 [Alphaproteobacteria bacterium]|nr:hypothetical protein [Alphaproteobacteria bacterium]